MFEVGFSEILMVGLVALLVIGPEKLPKFARMAGFWVAKSRRMIANVKQEINEEFQAEELRQMLKNKSGINELQQIVEDTTNDLRKTKDSVNRLYQPSLKQNDLDRDERQ